MHCIIHFRGGDSYSKLGGLMRGETRQRMRNAPAYAQRAHCAIARAHAIYLENFAEKTIADSSETARQFSDIRYCGCNTYGSVGMP